MKKNAKELLKGKQQFINNAFKRGIFPIKTANIIDDDDELQMLLLNQ